MKIVTKADFYKLPEGTLNTGSITRSIEDEATKRLYSNLHSKFDELFIEGLKRKGFEFENRLEAEDFVKIRCSCADNLLKSERTFYVDEVPFFLHKYKTEVDIPVWDEHKFYISASLGSYCFL